MWHAGHSATKRQMLEFAHALTANGNRLKLVPEPEQYVGIVLACRLALTSLSCDRL